MRACNVDDCTSAADWIEARVIDGLVMSIAWCERHWQATRESVERQGRFGGMGAEALRQAVAAEQEAYPLRTIHADAGTARAEPRTPRLGESVLYRPRVGDYWLAAIICRTAHSSSPEALHRAKDSGRDFMRPLALYEVDLTVFTPGGSYVQGTPSQWTGTYAEHGILYDDSGPPGTWCRFEDRLHDSMVHGG